MGGDCSGALATPASSLRGESGASFNRKKRVDRQSNCRYIAAMAPALSFRIALPLSYPIPRILGYLGRDAGSLTVRVDGPSFAQSLWIGGVPALLRVDLAPGEARATLEARRRLPTDPEDQ